MAAKKKDTKPVLSVDPERAEWQRWAELERRLAFGETLGREDQREHTRITKKRDLQSFNRLAESLPRKEWSIWSGRDVRILTDQAALYGIPVGGGEVSLPAVAKWIHEFLKENGRKIRSFDEDGSPEEGEALEEWRKVKTEREKLQLNRERKLLIDRDVVHDGLMEVAGMLRKFGELLQRQFGFESSRAFNEQLTDTEDRIETMLSSMAGTDTNDDGHGD